MGKRGPTPGAPKAADFWVAETESFHLVEDSAQDVGNFMRRRMYGNGGFTKADIEDCPFSSPDVVPAGQQINHRPVRTETGRHVWLRMVCCKAGALHLTLSWDNTFADPIRRLVLENYTKVEGWRDV